MYDELASIQVSMMTMNFDGEIAVPGGKYLPYRKGDRIATVVGSANRIKFILPSWFKIEQMSETKEPMAAEIKTVETIDRSPPDLASLSLSELIELAGDSLILSIKGLVTKAKVIKAIKAR